MADYYYYSDYHQNPVNYQYNQYYSNYDDSANVPRYDQYYYDTEIHGNSYELTPTPSLVGYYYNQHEFPDNKNLNFHEPDSTGVIESKDDDLDFKEYNPEPFHGGYNMSETYGKPLPPSNEICYPPSKIEPKIPPLSDLSYDFESIPPPYGKRSDLDLEIEEKPTNENSVFPPIGEKPTNENSVFPPIGEKPTNENSVFPPIEENPTNENSVCPPIEEKPVNGNFAIEESEEEEEEEEEKEEIRRQIPSGYGLEAMDLCEGVFGGYFPCFWKRKQGMYEQSNGSGGNEIGECDYWKGNAADYLFGNPNPYGGSMPEKGSYGDPVYSYQRHYPEQPLSEKVENGGNYSWLPNSRYY